MEVDNQAGLAATAIVADSEVFFLLQNTGGGALSLLMILGLQRKEKRRNKGQCYPQDGDRKETRKSQQYKCKQSYLPVTKDACPNFLRKVGHS